MFVESGQITTIPSPVNPGVALAAKRLDLVYPGWYRGIDIERLRLSSAKHCVLGQATRKFGPFHKRIGWENGKETLKKHARENDLPRLDIGVFLFDHYIPHWEREILARRA